MDKASLPARLGAIDAAANVMTGDIVVPFAFDEVYGRQVGHGLLEPAVHLWRHERAFVLGSIDWKLPRVREAVQWLQGQGYSVTVRNSGGAAVPLDPGVVNLSLILPNRQGDLDVQRHFALMAELIRQSLKSRSCRIETGEVSGSYCPGEFDVSVRGKKFCGIAQRRQTRAVIVQAFVLVEGSGEARGKLVKAFYDLAAGGASAADHPIVEPARMSSLSELVGDMTAEDFVGLLTQQLASLSSLVPYSDCLRFELDGLQQAVDDCRRRYPVHV